MVRKYAVIGTGALGGYYGACLQKSGCEVHFLLRSDFDQVAAEGLKIESINGDFTLPEVHAHASTATMPAVDGIIIALKTTQNHQLPALLQPLLGTASASASPTAVITLQNGLDVEVAMAEWLGNRPLLGGLCSICSNKVGPGHIRHLEYGAIRLGEYAGSQPAAGVSELLKQVAYDFQQAGIPIEITSDLRRARWRKLVWNIPFNGLSVVLNATTDAMVGDPDVLALVRELMAETIAAGNGDMARLSPHSYRPLSTELIETMVDHTRRMAPYRTSMKIDHDEGRPLEIEAILKNPIQSAQAAGVEVPKIEMLYRQLRFLDQR